MGKPKKLRKLKKKKKMGNPCAMYRLGICFETGRMVKADINTAALLISFAAKAGYTPAVEWINDYSFDDSAIVQAES